MRWFKRRPRSEVTRIIKHTDPTVHYHRYRMVAAMPIWSSSGMMEIPLRVGIKRVFICEECGDRQEVEQAKLVAKVNYLPDE